MGSRNSTVALSAERGFTLLELLIAMAVMAFGMLGVVGMLLVAVKGNAFGSRMTQATALAQSKMEQMRNEDYDNLYANCAAGFPDPCTSAPANMNTIAANDSGTGGDAFTGGSGDGLWSYTYASPPETTPLPTGMELAWGVRRNYPQPRLIYLVAVARWKERDGYHQVRLESIHGNF
jgi:prepilin-type N-terminal cleavage/methylation domain-containing protein